MEQRQRKIGGEGLRNRDIVNEDRISELPEALLLHIYSSLPTETVIATSVLSKRWKSLWKMMPNLKFDSDRHHTFSENVSRTLILHNAPILESLHLEVRYECDALELGLWIGIAFARHVRKLALNLDFEEEEGPVKFPGVLCRCNNTLEFLKLEGSILLNLPSPVGLKSLRELHLCYVNFKDEESVSNLLCGCPCLEDLVVKQESNDDVETFTIAVPSLQRLTLEDDYHGEGVGGYVINAPSLKYLNIKGCRGLEFCLIENAPELVEAKITEVYDITNENILLSLTSVKRLSLSFSPLKEIKYPTGIIFYQLVYLELRLDNRWRNQLRWNLLSVMLDSSPKLQILKLIDRWFCDKDPRLIGLKWNQPKCVPECLLFHLETFVWTGYDWQREDENEFATYILKNARRLKKATLSTKPIESKELEKLEKRREMLKELASVVRASNSCHLVFEAKTYTYSSNY